MIDIYLLIYRGSGYRCGVEAGIRACVLVPRRQPFFPLSNGVVLSRRVSSLAMKQPLLFDGNALYCWACDCRFDPGWSCCWRRVFFPLLFLGGGLEEISKCDCRRMECLDVWSCLFTNATLAYTSPDKRRHCELLGEQNRIRLELNPHSQAQGSHHCCICATRVCEEESILSTRGWRGVWVMRSEVVANCFHDLASAGLNSGLDHYFSRWRDTQCAMSFPWKEPANLLWCRQDAGWGTGHARPRSPPTLAAIVTGRLFDINKKSRSATTLRY